jgi:hypothetical protein
LGGGGSTPTGKKPCGAVTSAGVHRLKITADNLAVLVLLNPDVAALVPFAETAMLAVLGS